MHKLIKVPLIIFFSVAILITTFYFSTFIQTWWDSLDPGAQYYQPEIPDGMRLKVFRAMRYHGLQHKYRCDWENLEFTCERDGKTFDMFAYLEKKKWQQNIDHVCQWKSLKSSN